MKHPVPKEILEQWRAEHPNRVQTFAGRKRAAYWRKLGFPNLLRARAQLAANREAPWYPADDPLVAMHVQKGMLANALGMIPRGKLRPRRLCKTIEDLGNTQ